MNRLRIDSKGFTAIELVVVIVTLSILAAAVIVKNPFAISDYSTIAADQLRANIRLVQLNAMGMKKPQSISFFVDASDYGVYDMAGVRKKLPGNVAVSGSSTVANPLTFNSLGVPSTSGTIYLSGGERITVHPSTGTLE
jgi:prepilin-type N-terminal cleavage/methylation domain-containing protein